MPALRPVVKRRRCWIIWLGTGALVIAALADWNRPPSSQLSVQVYDKIFVQGYRALVRPAVKRFVRCRFHPTCSQYSREAMQSRGFVPGLWLTSRRLLRCHPWTTAGTYDPVPAR